MSRRVSRSAVALLVLSLTLQAPSAFAAARQDRGDGPDVVERIVRIVKKIIHHLPIISNDDPVIWPTPPKP